MKKTTAWLWLVVILLTASALRQYRLLDFPLYGDEVDEGNIALDILRGHIAPFYPQNEGNEPLYQMVMAPFFAILGDSTIANRFPSTVWSTIFVALMYTFSRVFFRSRRVGVMTAGITAILWWSTIFGRLGLREISQPVMMTPALIGLLIAFRDPSEKRARIAAIIGGIFAGLTSYTFLSGRGFPFVIVLFLAYTAIAHRDQLAHRWRALTLYAVLMIGISIPLLAYLVVRPELDYHVQDLASRSLLTQASADKWIQNLLDTVGMFTVQGDQNWVRNIPGRPVFPGIEDILFYLGVAACLWHWRKPEFALPLIVIATFLMPNILTEDPPRWTRSIGILPGLMVLPVLPVEWVWSRVERWTRSTKFEWQASAASALLVGMIGVSILARTATDMFQIWIDNPGIYWMTLAFYDGVGRYVNPSPDSTPLNYVMDYYSDWRRDNIQRGVQRSDVAMRYSVQTALVFPDDPRGGRIAFQILAAPPRVLLDAFLNLDDPIYVDARVDSEGQRPLRVYFVPRAQLDAHLARAQADVVRIPNTNTLVSQPKVNNVAQFLGYEILNPDARPGSDLNVLTYWKILKPPPSMAIFLHLVNAQNQVIAQFDGFEAITDDLKPGDIIVQLHTLALPSTLPTSTFHFELGAYTRDDLKRLPLDLGTDSVWLQDWPLQTR